MDSQSKDRVVSNSSVLEGMVFVAPLPEWEGEAGEVLHVSPTCPGIVLVKIRSTAYGCATVDNGMIEEVGYELYSVPLSMMATWKFWHSLQDMYAEHAKSRGQVVDNPGLGLQESSTSPAQRVQGGGGGSHKL